MTALPASTVETFRGLGVSAAIMGEIVGFVEAERWTTSSSKPTQELLSMFVFPGYRHQGIGTTLVRHLQKPIGQPFAGREFNLLKKENSHG